MICAISMAIFPSEEEDQKGKEEEDSSSTSFQSTVKDSLPAAAQKSRHGPHGGVTELLSS